MTPTSSEPREQPQRLAEPTDYDRMLVEVRRKLGSGFVIVPVYPDDAMICAALDQWDRGSQSYTDIYTIMTQNYVKRKAK